MDGLEAERGRAQRELQAFNCFKMVYVLQINESSTLLSHCSDQPVLHEIMLNIRIIMLNEQTNFFYISLKTKKNKTQLNTAYVLVKLYSKVAIRFILWRKWCENYILCSLFFNQSSGLGMTDLLILYDLGKRCHTYQSKPDMHS